MISGLVGLVDLPSSSLQVPDLNSEYQSVWKFRKGVKEATMFFPRGSELFFNLEANGLLFWEPNARMGEVAVRVEKKEEGEYSPIGPRGKR